jgi:hypothetical protein
MVPHSFQCYNIIDHVQLSRIIDTYLDDCNLGALLTLITLNVQEHPTPVSSRGDATGPLSASCGRVDENLPWVWKHWKGGLEWNEEEKIPELYREMLPIA